MRHDGRRLKKFDPMYQVACHIMAKRSDSMNAIKLDIPLQPMKDYMHDARHRGYNICQMDVILAAYLRTVAEYPGLNRFIANKTCYARHDVQIGMVVLQDGKMESHGSMSKFTLDVHDTIFEVHDKLAAYIDANRTEQDKNGTEKTVKLLLSIPGLLRFGVNFLKFLDHFGLLPKWVTDFSPFHCSLVISNLASIRTNYIYHHVYDFGTTGMTMTMGLPELVPMNKHGTVTFERCMPLGVVMDERIASGSYYAMAFRRMSRYFADPSLLETPPEKITEDL